MLNEGNDNGSGNGFHPLPPEPDESKKVSVHWENIMSFRYWGGALLFGLLFIFLATIAGFGSTGTQVFFWVGFGSSLLGGLVGRRYWCPYCRGMVRNKATVCQHCGREFEV